MSVHRGLSRFFHFELVRGLAAADALTGSGKKAPRAANDVDEVPALRGEAQASRVPCQFWPDEAG
jgi:hypothetical protein